MNAVVEQVMKYEDGEMTDDETLDFFGDIIRSGLVWKLQGSYGRTAKRLIAEGYVDRRGKVLKADGEPTST